MLEKYVPGKFSKKIKIEICDDESDSDEEEIIQKEENQKTEQ